LTRKGQATRDRIVAAAAQLMFDRGVAGTTTEDVQRAAGVSPSQIYHYFGDKKSLVKAVIAYDTDLILSVQQPMLSLLDSFEALEAWRDVIIDVQVERNCAGGCPIGSLASELSEHDAEARAALVAGFARWQTAIRDGLTAMQNRDELGADADPEFLALATLTALQGGLLMSQARRDTIALRAVLDAMIDRIRCHAPA
jgi:AcrR family transcriptional regulator